MTLKTTLNYPFEHHISLWCFQIRGMRKENDTLKGQIDTFRETVTVHEMELKANRETIMRLVSEVNKEQNKAAACSQDMEKLSDVCLLVHVYDFRAFFIREVLFNCLCIQSA